VVHVVCGGVLVIVTHFNVHRRYHGHEGECLFVKQSGLGGELPRAKVAEVVFVESEDVLHVENHEHLYRQLARNRGGPECLVPNAFDYIILVLDFYLVELDVGH